MHFPGALLSLPTCVLLLLLCSACTATRPRVHYGPRGLWQPNRFDRHGLEQGRWRTYYDAAKAQPFTAGRYRHGRPVRTFRYYAATGALDHSERYARQGFCEATSWHPGGQVARRGHAQWLTGPKVNPRFYWFGPWVSFAEKGDTTALETHVDGTQATRLGYENGRRTTLEIYDPRGRLQSTTRLR